MAAPVKVRVAASGAGQVRKEVNSINRIIANIGVGAGAALGVLAVQGVRTFEEIDTAARRVVTLLPDKSQEAVDRIRGQIQEVATESGQDAVEVANAFYDGLSSTVVGEDEVQNYVAQVARAATAGSADIGVAMDFATTATNAFGFATEDLSGVMDSAFATVEMGKTTLPELGSAYFNVAPIASALGVEMDEVNAQIAALTLQGVPTKQATTMMKAQFTELSDSTRTGLGQTFSEITGQTFPDFIAGGGTVNEALTVIAQHATDTNTPITQLAGSVEAAQAVLGVTGEAQESFSGALTRIDDSTGLTQQNFELMSAGIGHSIDQSKQKLDELLVKIGELVTKILEDLMPAFDRIVDVLDNEGVLMGVLIALGTMFGVTLVMRIASFVTSVVGIGGQIARAAPGIASGLSTAFAALGPAGWIILGIAAISAALVALEIKYGRVITQAETLAASEGRIEGATDDPHRGAGRSGISLGRGQDHLQYAGWTNYGTRMRAAQQERSATADASRWAAQAAGTRGASNFSGLVGVMPGMAKGGIVTDPTVALVGEGAHDEAVLPLPHGWQNMRSEPSVTINIQAQAIVGNENELMSMINEGLNEYFRHNPRRNMRYAGSKL